MSSFNASKYISCVLIHNKNTNSGKYPNLVKTMHLKSQSVAIVVDSLPTNPSGDVMANIPICCYNLP